MNNTQEAIVTQARTWLGTRYHHQGRLKKNAASLGGVDCIGLVVGVIRELEMLDGAGEKLLADYDEQNYSPNPNGERLREVIERHCVAVDNIQPGDLLLFRIFSNPQHVGIATDFSTGGLGVIHCHSRSGRVVEHVLTDIWRKMIAGVYRFQS